MSAPAKLTDAERAEAVAALQAEIASTKARLAVLELSLEALLPPPPVLCELCFNEASVDGDGLCGPCAQTETYDPDEEHRTAYYADIATGCL